MKYQTKQFCFKKPQIGFTLIELIFVVAIGGVLLTVAVPSFSEIVKENRLTTQTNDLVADVNLARTEAVARGVQVILCRSANSTAASAVCSGTSNTWSTGWLMYADDDGSGDFEIANDTLIRIGQPSDSTITIITNAAGDADLQYNADGTTNQGGGTTIFAICDERLATNGRQLNVNTMGRPRLTSSPITSCTAPA